MYSNTASVDNVMPEQSDQLKSSIAELIRDYFQRSQPGSPAKLWPLASNTIRADEVIAALDVLLSNKVTMGTSVRSFETQWSEYLKAEQSVMVNSGSSANLLAMSAMASPDDVNALRAGDEVIVPAVTWPTSVYPIAQVGCVPVLVDIDLDTLNVSPQTIRQAITPKTRAIMAVHLLGNPCDMLEIQQIARQHNLMIIEDCCEAHGAKIGDDFVGCFGDMSTFSFYFSHHMTTIEGGMISTRDGDKWADFLRSARSHGWTRDRSDRQELADRFNQKDDRWLFVVRGYNLRPMELSAAIGLVQLRKLPQYVRERARVRERLLEELHDCRSVLRFQSQQPGHFHSAFGFSIIVREQAAFSRDQLQAHLESHEIETRPVVGGNLARQPAFAQLDLRGPDPSRHHGRGPAPRQPALRRRGGPRTPAVNRPGRARNGRRGFRRDSLLPERRLAVRKRRAGCSLPRRRHWRAHPRLRDPAAHSPGRPSGVRRRRRNADDVSESKGFADYLLPFRALCWM